MTLVDAFLACRVCMPTYKALPDDESVFWKFAHAVIAQLDARPATERNTRENEPLSPTAHSSILPWDNTKLVQARTKEVSKTNRVAAGIAKNE
jgi:hypothetical protein